jgi:hypothetical protein
MMKRRKGVNQIRPRNISKWGVQTPTRKIHLPTKKVIGFPPTANEMAYLEDSCLEYVHATGPLDINCDFELVDKLVLWNLTRSSFQYTD